MPTSLTLRINNTTNDATHAAQPSYYVDVDNIVDYFIFSGGSIVVADGQSIPGALDLSRAGVQLDALNDVVVPKYFLADVSANLLKEVKLAGNQNKQFAFCVSFSGATASEPQLEAWDSPALTTISSVPLGSGTPNNSWYRAICTTTNPPGTSWIGILLAGAGAGNYVLLNDGNGALSGATDLYFNFKIIIPAGYVTPGSYTPVLNITYLTN